MNPVHGMSLIIIMLVLMTHNSSYASECQQPKQVTGLDSSSISPDTSLQYWNEILEKGKRIDTTFDISRVEVFDEIHLNAKSSLKGSGERTISLIMSKQDSMVKYLEITNGDYGKMYFDISEMNDFIDQSINIKGSQFVTEKDPAIPDTFRTSSVTSGPVYIRWAPWYDEENGDFGISISIESDTCTVVLSVGFFSGFSVIGCSCCE
jgi:hypothetical protein